MEEEIIKSANDTMMQLHNEVMQLNKRIDKAIEYITPYRDETINWYEFTINDKVKLLEILKGTDKE